MNTVKFKNNQSNPLYSIEEGVYERITRLQNHQKSIIQDQ
jgi:hypothetical protein